METRGPSFKEHNIEMDAIIFNRHGIYAGHLIPHSWTGSSIIPKKREKCGYTTCLMYMYKIQVIDKPYNGNIRTIFVLPGKN